MAKQLDPNDLVTLEELALSNMWETSALVELLERKGILTRQDVLGMIQELRQREPTAMPPRRLETCVRLIRHQPNGFHSKISFGSTVSAAKRAMNIADAINTPK